MAVLTMLIGAIVAVVAPQPAQAATDLVMQPVVAANKNNDNSTKRFATIVITGQNLPVAPVELIGQETRKFVQVNNITKGWLIGGVDAPDDCAVLIGASSSTELVIGVGNMDGGEIPFPGHVFSCFGFWDYIVYAGDVIEVKLFDPVTGVTTVRGQPALPSPAAAVPEVQAVSPPFGPMTGGNEVVMTTPPGSISPRVVWFGGYSLTSGWYGTATTNIAPDAAGPNRFKVVPPAFISKGVHQNYGVAVFSADAVTGITSENCSVLVTGCANEYLFLDSSPGTIEEFDLAGGVPGLPNPFTYELAFPGGNASPACGLSAGLQNGPGASVGISAGLAGKAKIDYDIGLSYSNAGLPEAVVGTGTLTVVEPITFEVTLFAKVSGCVEIPLLTIPGVGGLYVVVGGEIEGDITLQIGVAKGTYSFTGGWVPHVTGRDDTGGFGIQDVNCVDADGAPTERCVTTEITAGVKGTLVISPLWLQLGVDIPAVITANVGVGLTAAAVIEARFEGWPPAGQVKWDVCAGLRWAAEIDIATVITQTYGDNLLGPYNIIGDGLLCPLGETVGEQPPPPPTETVSSVKSSVVASPSTVAADGATPATVTVTLVSTDDAPVSGRNVALTPNGGSSVVSAASGPSDADGVVTFTVTDAVEEVVTYTATESAGGVTVAVPAAVTFANPPPPPPISVTKSTVKASPSTVAADGGASSTITVKLIATDDSPVTGKIVTLSASPGTSSVISAASGPSGPTGAVTFTVTDTVEETVTYTATIDGVAITQTAQVTFASKPPPPTVSAAKSLVTASPALVVADGTDASTVTVTLVNTDDSPAVGNIVTLEAEAGTSSVIGAASGVSDATGVVTFAVTDATEETVTYTATDETDGVVIVQTADVIFTNDEPVEVFRSLAPARVLDTRTGETTIDGLYRGIGLRPAGSVTELQVGGRGGVPMDATGAVLNLTVDGPQAPGFVTVFPCGSDRPNASNLNYAAGQTIANLVVAKIGVDGKVCIYTLAGTHIIADVKDGYFPEGSAYGSLVPARLLETRTGWETDDGRFNGLGLRDAGSTTELQVTGRSGVPSDAGAVVLNVTVDGPQAPGFVTVFPCGSDRPNASNLNYAAGQTIPNTVIAKIGVDGKVCIYTLAGTHIIADVNGYFPEGSAYGSLVPARLLETRTGWETDDGRFNGLGLRDAGSTTELQVTGRSGVPSDAGAVVLNVTVDGPQAPGFVTVFPCGSDRPNASNLNYTAGQTIPNTVIAKIGVDGKVCIYTLAGTHIIADVNGYFPG